MQFLYPSFLWALLALAIPIIVHLFYFRRFKKIYFTNVRFLKEIKEETSSRNKLKNLLVLLMRCLALACLVFAFAQPLITKNKIINPGTKAISIFVDNSFSMKAERENVPLLEIAKERARSIIEASSPDDKFQVISNDFEGRHQRLVSKENALTLVNELQISPSVQLLSTVINRQKQVLKEENNVSYVISDFQKSITNLDTWRDTSIAINLLPVQASTDKNVSIDSVWFEGPTPLLNQNNKLVIKLTNHSGNEAEDIKTSLFKDGQEKPIAIKNIAAHSSRTDTIALSIQSPGIHEAEIRVVDFPVQFDDTYFISFLIPEKAKVLSINQGIPNKYLDALFKGINYFMLVNQDIGQVQFQKFGEYDLILLNDLKSISSGLANELVQFIKAGGNVLIFPSADIDRSGYNSFLSQAGAGNFGEFEKKIRNVGTINTEEFIFSDVYEKNAFSLKLPVTKANYAMSNIQRSGKESLLKYRDGSDYISKFINEKGQIFICASPLNTDISDLVTNAEVFVPMIYKMALSKVKKDKLAYTIGRDNTIELSRMANEEPVYKIKGKSEFIPGITNLGKQIMLDIKGQVKEAGYYGLILDNKEIKRLAFNYNRRESNLEVNTVSELEDEVKSSNINIITEGEQKGLNQYIGENNKGMLLWKWFVIASLLFLLLESLIIRFVK